MSLKHVRRLTPCLMIFAVVLLTGCAGQHVKPPADYASSAPQALRVAFDQDGNFYPRDASIVDWQVEPTWYSKTFGGAFRLSETLAADGSKPYTDAVQQAARDSAIHETNARLHDGDTLVVLIHGFNNRFDEAKQNFELLKAELARSRPDVVTLEVYWDGLTTRTPHWKDMPGIASFWPDSLTYSNMAGQYGLRALLNGIQRDVHLRFVTHSRGAAVALSALTDPLYDPHIKRPASFAFSNPHIKSIKVASYAPAIGAGHLHADFDRMLSGHKMMLVLGVNKDDVATSKSLFSARFWGDTSLGSDLTYVRHELGIPRQNVSMRAVEFTHGRNHGLDAYVLRNPTSSACLLALIDLGPSVGDRCKGELR